MKIQTSKGVIDSADLNRMAASERLQFMRESYIDGLRTKGFNFTTAAGGAVSNKIDLSGQGTNFLGIAIFCATPGGLTVNLTINNDVVIQATPAIFIQVNGNTNGRAYYPLQRLLSGQDSITLGLTDAISQTVQVVVWYQ